MSGWIIHIYSNERNRLVYIFVILLHKCFKPCNYVHYTNMMSIYDSLESDFIKKTEEIVIKISE